MDNGVKIGKSLSSIISVNARLARRIVRQYPDLDLDTDDGSTVEDCLQAIETAGHAVPDLIEIIMSKGRGKSRAPKEEAT